MPPSPPPVWSLPLFVMLGGSIGSGLRYGVAVGVDRLVGRPTFPFGTLAVNLVGCLVIGLLIGRYAGRWVTRPELQLLLVTGLLGGFTTFSSFALESAKLLQAGRFGAVAAYLVVSNGVGVALALAGLWLGAASLGGD